MKKIIYKVLTIITLVAPISIYLFLSATLFNIRVDHKVEIEKNAEVDVYINSDRVFIYKFDNKITFYGRTQYHPSVRYYGIFLFEGDTIQVNKEIFVVEANEERTELVLNEISKFALNQKEGVSLPIAFILSGLGVLIVSLVVGGKMQWFKKRRRLGVFISLGVGTLVLYLINMVVANLFMVFLIALVSWGVYCIEYLAMNGFKGDDELKSLTDALNNVINKP